MTKVTEDFWRYLRLDGTKTEEQASLQPFNGKESEYMVFNKSWGPRSQFSKMSVFFVSDQDKSDIYVLASTLIGTLRLICKLRIILDKRVPCSFYVS